MFFFLILGLGGLYFVLTSLYRLYFHPLRRFPGPKLAAITHGYEFYHDVFRRGMYLWEIEKMHKKYGRQIRSVKEENNKSGVTFDYLL